MKRLKYAAVHTLLTVVGLAIYSTGITLMAILQSAFTGVSFPVALVFNGVVGLFAGYWFEYDEDFHSV